jgi:hypothetical protein
VAGVRRTRRRTAVLTGIVVYSDFQRLEESVVLRGELDLASLEVMLALRFGRKLLLGLFVIVALVKTDSGFQDEEDIISSSLYLADRFGDAIRFRKGIVYRISQLLHQVLQRLVHKSPLLPGCSAPRFRCTFPAGFGIPRIDCSGALSSFTSLQPIFSSAVPPKKIRCTITFDKIRIVVTKRNVYQESARVYKHGRKFLGFVVPAVLKPARTLWHEIIGFLFIAMSILFAFSGFRALREYDGSLGAVLRLAMLVFCVVLLGGYGISSFLRARRISRS